MNIKLSRLKELDPREVWPNEASDFTPWLADNADALADALGLDIELTAMEHPVGPFALDIIGRDLTNDCVLIVENQLTPTDHVHLGQIVTYAANTEAATIVWMAPSFREEHRQAIVFLNDLGGDKARFFGVEIGVGRIDESAPAPLFKLAAQPNEFHAQAVSAAKSSSQDATGKGALYLAFWERCLERFHEERPQWTRARKAQADNWFSMPSPFKGMNVYSISFPTGGRLRSELYLDALDPDEVVALYSSLEDHRSDIEAIYGSELSWEPLPGRRASRIAAYANGEVANVAAHPNYVEWFIDSGTRLRSALDPYARIGLS